MKKLILRNCYREKITFFSNVNTNVLDKPDWRPKKIVLGKMRPLSESGYKPLDTHSFGDIISAEYFLFRMREASDINKKMRIHTKGQWYEIKRIIKPVGISKEMKIIALAVD